MHGAAPYPQARLEKLEKSCKPRLENLRKAGQRLRAVRDPLRSSNFGLDAIIHRSAKPGMIAFRLPALRLSPWGIGFPPGKIPATG